MLPAAQRLTSPSSFREVVRRGQRCGGPLVVVHLLGPTGTADAPARAGLVVSKAVGGSVTRNRVKRRLRHLVREHLAGLPDGSLLVLRAQPAAASATSAELGAELVRCLAATSERARERRRMPEHTG